ncbi:hypothetical protein R1flu_027137 [Riccia fluitans]|uniref:Uncharacterized protein n=1 Tax=Riccia fluitans TaxID=41844 RepID=A0ABD1XIJ2_9MARC
MAEVIRVHWAIPRVEDLGSSCLKPPCSPNVEHHDESDVLIPIRMFIIGSLRRTAFWAALADNAAATAA